MRHARWCAVAAAVLILTSGCSPTPSPSITPQLTSDASLVTNQRDPGSLRDGGQVRVPITQVPAVWNPWHADATDDTLRVLDAARPHAFVYDAGGQPTPNADYVVHASATHDPATVVTLRLNPASVWGDGSPITAGDWIATWTALSGSAAGFDAAERGEWSRIASVRAGADDREVVLTYEGVDPDWVRPLDEGPLRAESAADPATFNTGWSAYRPEWFSGPFTVAHVDARQGVITLHRNPAWWGAKPRLEGIVFRTIQPEAVAAAFASNEYDVYDVGPSPDDLQLARPAADVSVRSTAGTTGRQLVLASDEGPLADLRVRQAVVRAVDRERLARTVLDDAGEAVEWSNHLLLTTQAGYTNQADATGLTHNAKAAGELLTSAGWVPSGGQRIKDGRALSLALTVDAGDTRSVAEAARLASDLSAVGIAVRQVSSGGDLAVRTLSFSAYPLEDAAALLSRTPSLRDLGARIEGEADPLARAGLATQAAHQLWEHAETLPLYQEPQVVAVKGGLANVGADAFASIRWTDIGWSR